MYLDRVGDNTRCSNTITFVLPCWHSIQLAMNIVSTWSVHFADLAALSYHIPQGFESNPHLDHAVVTTNLWSLWSPLLQCITLSNRDLALETRV